MAPIQRKECSRQGVSMVEVAISTLIVGIMLVAALQTVGAVFRTQRINATRLTGPGLAQKLMAEILAMPYEDPEGEGNGNGVETGEATTTRADFDDVDDYHNWDSANATEKDGTALADYTGWRREVDVRWADVLSGTFWPFESGVKRVQVRVTDPAGKVYDYYSLRWKDGALEGTPAVDRTVVTWIGAELRLGSSSALSHAGTNLTNQAIDSL